MGIPAAFRTAQESGIFIGDQEHASVTFRAGADCFRRIAFFFKVAGKAGTYAHSPVILVSDFQYCHLQSCLTPSDIQRVLSQENLELPSGRIEGDNTELTIKTFGRLSTPKEFNNIIVKQQDGVRLYD